MKEFKVAIKIIFKNEMDLEYTKKVVNDIPLNQNRRNQLVIRHIHKKKRQKGRQRYFNTSRNNKDHHYDSEKEEKMTYRTRNIDYYEVKTHQM